VVVEGIKSIDQLAGDWLAAERLASDQDNGGRSEERAREASAAYDGAVAAASREELLVAWHAARQTQSGMEMGSKAWSEARAVSELLRVEYQASEE
jgi:hypothetical protein